MAYAELAVTSNYSFLRGASHPHEMVERAKELGLAAIGLADRNSFAGVVRAHAEAKGRKIRFLPGVRLVTTDGFQVLAYPTDRAAYGRLCRLLTDGNRRAKKAQCHIGLDEICGAREGQMLIVLPPDKLTSAFKTQLVKLAGAAPAQVFLGMVHRHKGDERQRFARLAECAHQHGTPLVALNDVHYHRPERRPLADVLTCIREKCTITEAGFRLDANAERHLKSEAEMLHLFAGHEEAVRRSAEIAARCRFSLDDLKYEYPDEPVPPGKTPQEHLTDLAWKGAAKRYKGGVPEDVAKNIREELRIIEELDYARYFLTVHDVVAFARSRYILCQGRGSAANSTVCYCLGITEVNPTSTKLLFSRFISQARNEPPDIDVDFEHERREEVIQYIYVRYTRERAAICATVVHYRSRRAIREVGQALGLTPDVTAALAKTIWGYGDHMPDQYIREAGFDPDNGKIRQAVDIANELIGFPRHLSQHVGGFVLTQKPLSETVPIGNAAMEDRTFIEWDKDDIDALGLMKVDVLALGMLSCLRRALEMLRIQYRKPYYTLDDLPYEDPATYEMLSKADSVGVFQVESRAQMSMLPRLKPEKFYDLVIEVAIVRPGPIQGNMVHPYLKRRDGIEKTVYPSPDPAFGPANELEEVLKRTMGVPLFQEQAMQIAITAAGFSHDDADRLRRSMATFRNKGSVRTFRDKFITGMTRRGYDQDFAERCFSQIEGFGEYGFPESHAASFALLVYASAYIKCHHPDVFCAAILNSQPMGFYQPAQLVRDAREHDVEVRPVDINDSHWDCTLERLSKERSAVRLGFRQIGGLKEEEVNEKLVARRGNGYSSLEQLARRSGAARFTLERLAEADALTSLGLDRRNALWAMRRLSRLDIDSEPTPGIASASNLPLFAPHIEDGLFHEPSIALPQMQLSEEVIDDYETTGLSLKAHPCRFFRADLEKLGAITSAAHRAETLKQNTKVTVAGIVLMRQMPSTAKGVVFITLEDETGIANIIVWPQVLAENRRVVMTGEFLAIRGRLQREGLVIHVIAERFVDLTAELRKLRQGDLFEMAPPALVKSRDFH
ncbi:error-prone DNA polymerase [Nordella sp. HKS 07]|uniref:error-prone DNA polymerase n=1 Tax=Nordella sp. HKS 07 TaxID=2712222 RepID=UPI0013E1DBAE|nr:error-prone DNA polymerase [Nordella sp. HKS 07]QIG49035.1 error-prone DNA polymerase [Nordella sp. HKS 07]